MESRRSLSRRWLRGAAIYVRNRADFAGLWPRARCCAEIPQCNESVATVLRRRADWGPFPLASEAAGVSGLAERYAAALFDLADERHALDAVAGDLRELRDAEDSGDLSRLLRSPVLSREEQGKAVAAVAERAGLSELTRDFSGSSPATGGCSRCRK